MGSPSKNTSTFQKLTITYEKKNDLNYFLTPDKRAETSF